MRRQRLHGITWFSPIRMTSEAVWISRPNICLDEDVEDVFRLRLQKTSSRRFWRRLQGFFKTSCKDIFKMFSKRIIKLNCSCSIAKTVIYRRICLGHTSEKFMVSVQSLLEWKKFLKFYYFTTPLCTTPFSGVVTEAYLESGLTSTMELFCGNTEQL